MTAGAKTELPRLLSLSEVAERLRMKPPNVAKFLARRGVEPAFAKAQGYFWREDVIEQVKAEREADKERMAADEKRRRAALEGAQPRAGREPKLRVGEHQAQLLETLLRRPLEPDGNAQRLALRRLRLRGLVEQADEGHYQLTEAGRELAGRL